MKTIVLDCPEELQRVEDHISESIHSGCDLLREVADYINLGQGKKLRPRMVIMVTRAMNGSLTNGGADINGDSPVTRVAASVELVHLASLLHDDVIDKTMVRRGRPSVNAQYGDDVAILMADLLFSHAFDLALSALKPEVVRLICQATRSMCESEMFQIEKREAVLTPENYYYIIRSKTASLFSTCAHLGGVLAGANKERCENLARFGEFIGMAYQITDDILDYTATVEKLGKPHGNDLAQGKQTLPFVYTCQEASPEDREILLAQLHNGRQMAKVLPLIEKIGGLDYSHRKAREFADQAEALVPAFESDATEPVFRKLCQFVVDRTY